MPMRILSFVSFCSFVGLSLKQSCIKPSNTTPSSWTRSLIKTTLSLLALSTLHLTACEGGDIFAKHTIKTLDEKSSIKLLVIGALTASATSTFLIPRMGYFIPHILGSSLLCSLIHTLQTKKSLDDALALFQKSAHYPLLLLLGSSIGLLSRSLLGPKNYTPSLPLLAKVPLYCLIITLNHWFIVLCPRLLSRGPKVMTDTDIGINRSFKDALLDRIQLAENSNFNSFKDLEKSITQKFPTTSDSLNASDAGHNFMNNKIFKIFTYERLTQNRQLPEVLRELKEFLNRLQGESLKEGFLKRFDCANERCFDSFENLDDHISQGFPGPSNFLVNKAFMYYILKRHTTKRSIRRHTTKRCIQVVLTKFKKELDKIP